MARKTVTSSKKTPAKAASKAKAVASTPLRTTPSPMGPKPAPAAKAVSAAAAAVAPAPKLITQEMIAVRAFEISCGPNCGSEFDNWLRAERELRGA